MFLGLKWPTQLAGVIRNELQNLIASINAWSNVEHKDDGTHGAITAESLDASGDVSGGNATFSGNLKVRNHPTGPLTWLPFGNYFGLGVIDAGVGAGSSGYGLLFPKFSDSDTSTAWFLGAFSTPASPPHEFTIGHADAAGQAILRVWKSPVPPHGEWALVPDQFTNVVEGVHLGADDSGRRFRTIHGYDVYANFGYYERGRSTRMGEWEAYTPVWTNITLGNATSAGSFTRVGKTVFYKIRLVWGSTTSASGVMSVSLPTASAVTGLAVAQAGHVWVLDASSNQRFVGQTRLTDLGTIDLWTNAAPNVRMSSTVPFTWAQGDQMYITGWYEEA